MDFFEHQDVARKKSGQLVFLFGCAVAFIALSMYVISVLLLGWAMQDRETGAWAISWINPFAAVVALLLVLGIVGGGTVFKLLQLRAGGQVVANHLGGRLLHREHADRLERGLLNIVEEMAIASGTPVPPVYVMDNERGINAFAAGYAPSSAVIGVTRGAMEQLTRSEMQGVIAHEFSHILNGDMRLNIRLMGVIHGILLLGIIGHFILRSMFYGSIVGGSRRREQDARLTIALGAIAVTMIVLGAVGTFFGSWIKAAVSRQREFLADASAVQFTRDPDTIGGALKAIGGWKHRARVDSPYAPEASHMFFGQAMTSGFAGMFATHPPLEQRIKRIDANWDGTIETRGTAAYPKAAGDAQQQQRPKPQRSSAERLGDVLPIPGAIPGVGDVTGAVTGAGTGQGMVQAAVVASAIASIGTIDQAHVDHAQRLLASIPDPIRQATGDAFSARAVVFGLLLHESGPARETQLRRLKEHADEPVVRALAKILPAFEGLPRELRLPILDIAAPELASMTPDQVRTFLGNCRALAEADEQIEPFEWALLRIVERRLSGVMGQEHRPRVEYYALNKLGGVLSVLLSNMARAGHENPEHREKAFGFATQPLGVPGLHYMGEDDSSLVALGKALDTLATVAPKPKKQIVNAVAACVAADKKVTPDEAELFRVIADELGVPTPPLMPRQPLL